MKNLKFVLIVKSSKGARMYKEFWDVSDQKNITLWVEQVHWKGKLWWLADHPRKGEIWWDADWNRVDDQGARVQLQAGGAVRAPAV